MFDHLWGFYLVRLHPPLDLNKQMMDGYREEMRKHYVNKTVKFV